MITLNLLGKVHLLRRGGGGGGGRCLEKSSYFYRVPVGVIGKFSMPPLHVFKIFIAPPQNSESKEYNPEFSLIIHQIKFAVPQDV